MNSIRFTLLRWLIAPLLAINLLGAGLTYGLAWIPAQTAFDQSLADAAWALIPQIKEFRGSLLVDLPQTAEQVLRVDHFDAVFLVVRTADGKTLMGDKDFPPLLPNEKIDTLVAYDGAMRGERIRITAIHTIIGNTAVLIGAAETLRKREHIRNMIILALIALELLLTAVLVGIVWIAVTKGMLPLKKLQTDLNQRAHNDLSLIDNSGEPVELKPVTSALNGLLDKVHKSTESQKDFLAEVTHQLRTPLAGMKLQLEWLEPRLTSEPEMNRSAQLMLCSTQRMIRQTNQLLALARAEPSRFEKEQLERIELNKLIAASMQPFVDESGKKKIDLGFELQSAEINGDAFLLADLIDNLIDNAIRYSPAGASVTVRCMSSPAGSIFSVEDSGPGIPEHERELIFSRFYRQNRQSTGTGLGLAIVRDIADDHDAKVIVSAGADGKGSIFSVHFPPL
jgi:two-component system, OmpR family, sensor histidine kinase TctE